MKKSQTIGLSCKSWCYFYALLIIFGFVSLAQADNSYAGLYYTNDSTSVTITGYYGDSNNITIPSTIDGLPVVRVEDEAFDSNTNLTGITIPSSLLK
jgi:hypothetical protein